MCNAICFQITLANLVQIFEITSEKIKFIPMPYSVSLNLRRNLPSW